MNQSGAGHQGPAIDAQATAAIHAPPHETEPCLGMTVVRDLAYRPDERHTPEVFRSG